MAEEKKQQQQTRVQIGIQASNLKGRTSITGLSTTPSPYAVVAVLAGNWNEQPTFLGKTEIIKKAASPKWITTFETTFTFGKETRFLVTIFDEVQNTGQTKPMGSACFEMGEVLGSKGCIKSRKLKGKSGTVHVRVTKVDDIDYGTLHLQLKGIKLKNVDGFFYGKSDPYFLVQAQATEPGGPPFYPVYRSEAIMDNLNPEWQEASIPVSKLCGGDKNRSIQIEVWDWEKTGRHKEMGKFQTSLNGLLSRAASPHCTETPVYHDPTPSTTEGFKLVHKGKSYGTVAVLVAHTCGGCNEEELQQQLQQQTIDEEAEESTSRSSSTNNIVRSSWRSRSSRASSSGQLEPLVRSQEEVQERFVPLCENEGKVYRKNVSSYVRRAIKGEEIVTEIDGIHESQKMVDDDTSWVVCGKAAGERYVLTDKEFHESYDVESKTPIGGEDEDGGDDLSPQMRRLHNQGFCEYKSKRFVWGRVVDDGDMRFFHHGAKKSDFAYFMAPWKEPMRVEKGDLLVTQYIPNGTGNGEVYRIERIVFEDSYIEEDVQPNQETPNVRSQQDVQDRFVPLMKKEGRVFRKKVSSYIRKAKKGEEIVTTINGVHESQKRVEDDSSWVVCGKAAGEHYVLTDKEFHESYDEESAMPISNSAPQGKRLRRQGFSEYESKRFVWGHIVDDGDMDFFRLGADSPNFAYFVAPWNENMRVEKGDILVTQYTPGEEGNGEVYRVEQIVFEDSYVDIEEETKSPRDLAPDSKPEFIDYISGGTEISLVAAIDFTGGNGDPRQPGTLHHRHRDGQLNDYEKALTAVGSIVARYDYDKMFPVLGFGAKYGGVIQHCFQVGNAEEVKGVRGMLEAYRSVFQGGLVMSGPTVFADVIHNAATQARKKQDAQSAVGKQSYTILLILTKGGVSDIEKTKQAIRRASTAPLSVVIVGIGNADFSDMKFLDDFQRQEGSLTRDIVQFVEFSKHQNNREALTRETLDEIPEQLVGYFFGNGILPLPPDSATVSTAEISEGSSSEDDSVVDLIIDVNENGDISLANNAPGTTWDSRSYGLSSMYLRQSATTLAYAAPSQMPTAVPISPSYGARASYGDLPYGTSSHHLPQTVPPPSAYVATSHMQPPAPVASPNLSTSSLGGSSHSYTPYSPGGTARQPYVVRPAAQSLPYIQPRQNSAQNMYQPSQDSAYASSSSMPYVQATTLQPQSSGYAYQSASTTSSAAPYVSPQSIRQTTYSDGASYRSVGLPELISAPLPVQILGNPAGANHEPYASASTLPAQDTEDNHSADSTPAPTTSTSTAAELPVASDSEAQVDDNSADHISPNPSADEDSSSKQPSAQNLYQAVCKQ